MRAKWTIIGLGHERLHCFHFIPRALQNHPGRDRKVKVGAEDVHRLLPAGGSRIRAGVGEGIVGEYNAAEVVHMTKIHPRRPLAWSLPLVLLFSACQPAGARATLVWTAPDPTATSPSEASGVNTSAADEVNERIDPAVESVHGRERSLPVAIAIVKELNLERSSAGLPALQMEAELVEIAFARAEDLVRSGYFDHLDPRGQEVPARVAMVTSGYTGKLAEVMIAVFGPLEAAVPKAIEGWWESEAHRTVLMDPGFSYIGVGLASDQVWWKVVVVLAEAKP